MGWLFKGGYSKADIVADLKRQLGEAEGRLVAASIVGNHFWAVAKDRAGEAAIVLCLLGKDGAYGWGYKDMDESMGPN